MENISSEPHNIQLNLMHIISFDLYAYLFPKILIEPVTKEQ